MAERPTTSAEGRLESIARKWGVTVDTRNDTATSLIAFGRREGEEVVLKIAREEGDEWRAGEILRVWDGQGAVRCLQCEPGAALMERAAPGTALVSLCDDGRDDEAGDVIAGIIEQRPRARLAGVASAEDWGRGFERYLAGDDAQLDRRLVDRAGTMWAQLCATQAPAELLHGDLQHYNVLHDRRRGWLAIDPKGVMAERAFEIGAILRNPHSSPELLTAPRIRRRAGRVGARLSIDVDRILSWGFAQAVLSAIWSVEDGDAISPDMPALLVANAFA